MRIEPLASRQAALWLGLTHAAGLAALPFTGLPVWACVLAGGALLAGLRHAWLCHANRRHQRSVKQLVWRDGSDCTVGYTDGSGGHASLAPVAFVTPWLVILYYRERRRHHSLFLLPDMLPADTFRRLRVRLRLASARGPAGRRAG